MTTCLKRAVIWFTVRVSGERLSICVSTSFPSGFEGGL